MPLSVPWVNTGMVVPYLLGKDVLLVLMRNIVTTTSMLFISCVTFGMLLYPNMPVNRKRGSFVVTLLATFAHYSRVTTGMVRGRVTSHRGCILPWRKEENCT